MFNFILTVHLVGLAKKDNPVLANPKVVAKVDEPVVDVALSVSRTPSTSCPSANLRC